MENKWKKGDIHPITGNVFWSRSSKNKSGEQWYKPDVYAKRVAQSKERMQSEHGKL